MRTTCVRRLEIGDKFYFHDAFHDSGIIPALFTLMEKNKNHFIVAGPSGATYTVRSRCIIRKAEYDEHKARIK